MRRLLGVPWLFAVSYSAVGFSIYFSIGIVADKGLALTPLIFGAVGLVFILNDDELRRGLGDVPRAWRLLDPGRATPSTS